jgi:hypothetical protein
VKIENVIQEKMMTSGQLVEELYQCVPENYRINRNRDSLHLSIDGQKLTLEIRPNRNDSQSYQYSISPQGGYSGWVNKQKQLEGEIDTKSSDFKTVVNELLKKIISFMAAA